MVWTGTTGWIGAVTVTIYYVIDTGRILLPDTLATPDSRVVIFRATVLTEQPSKQLKCDVHSIWL
jgi:hypothetical protein